MCVGGCSLVSTRRFLFIHNTVIHDTCGVLGSILSFVLADLAFFASEMCHDRQHIGPKRTSMSPTAVWGAVCTSS